jgi:hypothetical protein
MDFCPNKEEITRKLTVLFLFICWAVVEPNPLFPRPLIGLLSQPCMIDGYGAIGGMNDLLGKSKYRRKHSPYPLAITDLT